MRAMPTALRGHGAFVKQSMHNPKTEGRTMRALLCFLLIGFLAEQQAFPQFGCGTILPTPTISERVAKADYILLVEWVSAAKRLPNDADSIDHTMYKLVEVIKDSPIYRKTSDIMRFGYWEGKPGDLVLLLGGNAPDINSGKPVPMTRAALDYLKAVPKLDVSLEERLAFHIAYLESPDELVAEDAYEVLDNAGLEGIRAISARLPREKLRHWLVSEKTGGRIQLYGLMLGVCGTEDDAKLLAEIIKQPVKDNDIRAGIEGVMQGYLLLKGEAGLELLEETKLKPGATANFSESYFARWAVHFAWHDLDSIKKDRLKQSMRLLLAEPTLAELAIGDLASWKDWDAQDQVMALYDKTGFENPDIKWAIVRYMLACSDDTKENADQNPVQEHAITVRNHLFTLRQNDPETVKKVESYYRIDK
jgi:hypothetical protein